jgi:hypothetical protein
MHIVKVARRVGHTHNAHYQGSKKAIAFVIDVLSGDAGCAGKGASHMDRRPIAAHFAWARTARGGAWADAGIGATVTDVRRSARALGGNGPAQALETVLLLFFVGSWTLANCVVLAPGPELVCFF